MLHFAPRSVRGRALFDDWIEARGLWDALTTHARPTHLLLMPDHLHALADSRATVRGLRTGMNAFAQWRNARRGEQGPVWRHRERVQTLRGGSHLERSERYIFLNPCRAKLAADPLAWAFSSYRDALGFSLPAMRGTVADPQALHAYVSADRTTSLEGSALPVPRGGRRRATLSELLAATSSLTRTPLPLLACSGPARRLYFRAARELTDASSREIGAALGARATTVRAGWKSPIPGVSLVARLVGDPRFAPLSGERLTTIAAWTRFLQRPWAQPDWKPRRRRRG